MKRNVLILLMMSLACFNLSAQLGLGLRDTRFVNVNYTIGGKYNIELEHSLYNEKFSKQHVRLSFSYKTDISHFTIKCKPYFGTIYSADYCDLGVRLGATYHIGRVDLGADINPHYDSGYKYTTCWRAGASCRVYKELRLVAEYTTIPEYRESEKRVRAGFRYGTERLWVMPLFSTCIERFDSWKTSGLRVSVSMGVTL